MPNILFKKNLLAMRGLMHVTAIAVSGWMLVSCTTGRSPAHSAPELPGSSWQLSGYDAASGGRAATVRTGQVRLSFGHDGRLSAKLDCNRGFGPYTVAPGGSGEGRIHIGPLGVTRMMCTESDDVSWVFTHDLDKLSSYRLAGDTLVLSGGAATGTYTLKRETKQNTP